VLVEKRRQEQRENASKPDFHRAHDRLLGA
jgi:hypothetical protein